jgi:hypothetical protein
MKSPRLRRILWDFPDQFERAGFWSILAMTFSFAIAEILWELSVRRVCLWANLVLAYSILDNSSNIKSENSLGVTLIALRQ